MAQHPWAINKKNLTIMCLSIAINLTRYIDEKKTNNFMPAEMCNYFRKTNA
jgi:hypothetical protein